MIEFAEVMFCFFPFSGRSIASYDRTNSPISVINSAIRYYDWRHNTLVPHCCHPIDCYVSSALRDISCWTSRNEETSKHFSVTTTKSHFCHCSGFAFSACLQYGRKLYNQVSSK